MRRGLNVYTLSIAAPINFLISNDPKLGSRAELGKLCKTPGGPLLPEPARAKRIEAMKQISLGLNLLTKKTRKREFRFCCSSAYRLWWADDGNPDEDDERCPSGKRA